MFKIKHQRTADCVVAGYRLHKTGDDLIGSLLLGLYNEAGELAGVRRGDRRLPDGDPQDPVRRAAATGDHSTTIRGRGHARRRARTPRNSEYSRWNNGKDLSFVPLRPERVVEVRYEHMEGVRFRHTAQFNRWRPNRDPRSCTYEQLDSRSSTTSPTSSPPARTPADGW